MPMSGLIKLPTNELRRELSIDLAFLCAAFASGGAVCVAVAAFL
jgi:hypothetical protein